MTIWRMRIACWITKATDTLRICNTDRSSIATMVLLKHLHVTSHVHCMYCCFLNFTLFPQVGINMEEFPEFRSELHFVEQMVTEESVFCLPSKVSNLHLSRYLLSVLVTVKPELGAFDLICMPCFRNVAVNAMKVM